jgi:hypothetical protein
LAGGVRAKPPGFGPHYDPSVSARAIGTIARLPRPPRKP